MNFDPHEEAMHSIVASMRFPGPNYYEVLRWLHEDLKPDSYLEIGVGGGHSLKLAAPPTIALGIDPFPEVDDRWTTATHVAPMRSSEFFAKHTLKEFFGADHFSLAFVDGCHRFQPTINDIFNLEIYAQPESVIAVHDTIPLDQKTAARNRHARFYTGDVWKVVPFLKQSRPDLELITVRTGPSGLTLIRRLNPSHARSKAEIEALGRFEELPWEHYKRHRHEFLETIANERSAVASWLCTRIYDQHHHSGV
jgi:Methyltransferase domain